MKATVFESRRVTSQILNQRSNRRIILPSVCHSGEFWSTPVIKATVTSCFTLAFKLGSAASIDQRDQVASLYALAEPKRKKFPCLRLFNQTTIPQTLIGHAAKALY